LSLLNVISLFQSLHSHKFNVYRYFTAVMDAMAVHPNDASVLEASCGCLLASALDNEEAKEALELAGTVGCHFSTTLFCCSGQNLVQVMTASLCVCV
jgi:hypothetical protein